MKLIKMLTPPIKALTIAMIAMSAGARDWYIDAQNGSDVTGDGTEGAPFETINRASTNSAFTAGETIWVQPGDYDKGFYVDAQGMTNRVCLAKKTILKAVSSDPRATRIIGAWDTTSGNAMKTGPAAIRCVRAVGGGEMHGFTICNGSTNSTGDNDASRGGGVYAGSFYIVDCIIENCRAYKGGGVRDSNSIRTFFIGNSCSDAGGGQNGGQAYFCVFIGNGGSGTLSSAKNVNCTFIGSTGNPIVGSCTAYNAFFCAEASGCANSVKLTNCVSSATYDIVSPVSEDYRLVKGCTAETAGDRNLIAEAPSAYRDQDILGNAIPAEGPIPVGAVFASAEVVSGGFFFKSGSGTVDGHAYGADSWYRPSVYPALSTIVPAASSAGKPFLCFSRTGANGGRTYPQMDGTFHMLPPPDKTAMSTLKAVYADKVIYVNADPTVGSDTTGTGAASAPYETLHKAVTVAGKNVNTLILAAAGDYRKGGKPLTEQGASNSPLTNIVNVGQSDVYCLIRGAGAATTFITGAPDPDTKGLGARAVRAAALFSPYAAIQGFTIRDSYSDASAAVGGANDTCAILMRNNFGAEAQAQLLDCVVTNCHSAGYGFSSGRLQRCRIVGNAFGSNIANNNSSVSCEYLKNVHGSGNSALPGNCRLFGCTVVGQSQSDLTMGSGPFGTYLTIFETGSTVYSNGAYGGDIAHNIATVQSGTTGFTVGDPALTDIAGGDLRPMKTGIAATASGDVVNSAWLASAWPYIEGDVAGLSRAFAADGTIVVGANAELVDAVKITAAHGGLSIVGAKEGMNPVTDDTEITISFGRGATQPCVGFAANGVTNLFAVTPSRTFTKADVEAAGGILNIEAVYSSDWYVDANSGNDANSGMLPGDAFLTLARALTNSLLTAGQTVHAARGLYASGELKVSSGSLNLCRAIVPKEVTLVADEGSEVTEIRGADGVSKSTLGLGTNAVRCVYLKANSRIRGFTLSNGRTREPSASETNPEKSNEPWLGGGAAGVESASCVVENCVITNCCANRGGAGWHVRFLNCRVVDNHAVNAASAGYYVHCYGSLFAKNSGSAYVIQYPDSFINCTLADDNSGTLQIYHLNTYPLVNSLVMGSCNVNTKAAGTAKRCIFTVRPTAATGGEFNFYGEGGFLTNAAAVKLDAAYRPAVDSCVVDAAIDDGTYVPNLTDKDASGGQRVYNGALDVGALEGDWRGTFARKVRPRSRRGFVVAAASSGVQTATDGVTMTDGETLTVDWTVDEEASAGFNVAVAGEGSLSVKVNGEDVSVTDGVCAFNLVTGANVVEIAFAGTGTATVGGFFGAEKGMLLIVR